MSSTITVQPQAKPSWASIAKSSSRQKIAIKTNDIAKLPKKTVTASLQHNNSTVKKYGREPNKIAPASRSWATVAKNGVNTEFKQSATMVFKQVVAVTKNVESHIKAPANDGGGHITDTRNKKPLIQNKPEELARKLPVASKSAVIGLVEKSGEKSALYSMVARRTTIEQKSLVSTESQNGKRIKRRRSSESKKRVPVPIKIENDGFVLKKHKTIVLPGQFSYKAALMKGVEADEVLNDAAIAW